MHPKKRLTLFSTRVILKLASSVNKCQHPLLSFFHTVDAPWCLKTDTKVT